MAIISPLPYTIANGDPVDATPVQANLNQIVSNVNANAAPVGGNAATQFLVATTTNPAGAVPLAQAQSQFAPISGSNVYALAAGSSGQVFNVANATASTEAVQLAQVIGGGAAANWTTNLASSRSLNTAYTNNTGRPLVVSIQATNTINGGGNYVSYLVGGNACSTSNWNPTASPSPTFTYGVVFVVPPGQQYAAAFDGTPNIQTPSILAWYEY